MTGADPRFAVKGPYWRPGMSVLVEPWAAVAETNVGHWAVLHGRHPDRAQTMVSLWQLHVAQGRPIEPFGGVMPVSAAVVNPRGEVVAWWGIDGAAPPVPGGPPRWSPLSRVPAAVTCQGCQAERWPGCWMPRDLSGCAECLPDREAADPRRWPLEPPRPGAVVQVHREKTPRKRKAPVRASVVSPDEGRLF